MATPKDTSIDAVVLHADDDVAVLIRPVVAGEIVAIGGARGGSALRANAGLPTGHKLALHPLAAGAEVRKYGEAIGRLTAAVAAGDHVHVHNLVTQRGH